MATVQSFGSGREAHLKSKESFQNHCSLEYSLPIQAKYICILHKKIPINCNEISA